MTTINLEKSLLRQNKKLVMPEELLQINEYDKFTELVENDALTRVGLNRTLKMGREIKNRISNQKEQTKPFNQERVFHISQIESICKKYHLRFLRASLYRGIIDTELPNRISNFEIAYSVKCTSSNTKIVAPMESFELSRKPKDPLMFYQINNEYFYLIHKWGNDLNIFRSAMPYLANWIISVLIISFIFTFPLYLINLTVYLASSFGCLVWLGLCSLITSNLDGMAVRICKRNNWDREHD